MGACWPARRSWPGGWRPSEVYKRQGYLAECVAGETIELYTGQAGGLWYVHGADQAGKSRFDGAVEPVSYTHLVNFSSIDLFCADCGGAMRIPAATASDIDDICCKNKLVIHGQD